MCGAGDHFGTLLTLSAGEKKRPFNAVAHDVCELAVISRVGYNRILKQQLQGAIERRVTLLKGLAFMRATTMAALQRVATNCQDEVFSVGARRVPHPRRRRATAHDHVGESRPATERCPWPRLSCPAGCVVVDPNLPPSRIFFIMEGEAKLVRANRSAQRRFCDVSRALCLRPQGGSLWAPPSALHAWRSAG